MLEIEFLVRSCIEASGSKSNTSTPIPSDVPPSSTFLANSGEIALSSRSMSVLGIKKAASSANLFAASLSVSIFTSSSVSSSSFPSSFPLIIYGDNVCISSFLNSGFSSKYGNFATSMLSHTGVSAGSSKVPIFHGPVITIAASPCWNCVIAILSVIPAAFLSNAPASIRSCTNWSVSTTSGSVHFMSLEPNFFAASVPSHL